MAKLIQQEDGFYRMRRGKLVKVPDEWVGKTTHKQTIRKRLSKKPPKIKKWAKQLFYLRDRVARGDEERKAINGWML